MHGSTQNHTKTDKNNKVLHKAKIPSIPFNESSFGYEESVNGDLIQQARIQKTFKGTPGDTVGPGQYETNTLLANNIPGGNWHISKVKRMEFQPSTNSTSPATYNVHLASSKSAANIKGTYSFLSNVPKESTDYPIEIDEDKIEPGPGAYNIDSNTSLQRLTKSIQNFG